MITVKHRSVEERFYSDISEIKFLCVITVIIVLIPLLKSMEL